MQMTRHSKSDKSVIQESAWGDHYYKKDQHCTYDKELHKRTDAFDRISNKLFNTVQVIAYCTGNYVISPMISDYSHVPG